MVHWAHLSTIRITEWVAVEKRLPYNGTRRRTGRPEAKTMMKQATSAVFGCAKSIFLLTAHGRNGLVIAENALIT
jgi:hypothetical protein